MTTETLIHSTGEHERNAHEERHSKEAKALFGFWIYIMSDVLLFGSLFAAYAVLQGNTFGGPSAKEIFSLPFVLTETLLLLASTFTFGLVSVYAHHHKRKDLVIFWTMLTMFLGIAFLAMEVSEFRNLVSEGYSWQVSGFLSSFFGLVGTHGLHVMFGVIWMAAVLAQVLERGLTETTIGKITTLGLFWHFLDIVWIFIFTFVYLMGAI